MKKLELKQMEEIQGGGGCGYALATALVFGTGGLIMAATGGVVALAFAMASNYAGWIGAAITC